MNVGTRTDVRSLAVTFHALRLGLIKPSGWGLLGDNPTSDRSLRVSGLAAMGAQVF